MSSGAKALLDVAHLVSNNLPWIHAQLDIPPLLGKKTSPGAEAFVPSVEPRADVTFNPLKEFACIGAANFDMVCAFKTMLSHLVVQFSLLCYRASDSMSPTKIVSLDYRRRSVTSS